MLEVVWTNSPSLAEFDRGWARALDSVSGELLESFVNLVRRRGAAVLLMTHDVEVASDAHGITKPATALWSIASIDTS